MSLTSSFTSSDSVVSAMHVFVGSESDARILAGITTRSRGDSRVNTRQKWRADRQSKDGAMIIAMGTPNAGTIAFGNRDFWPEVVERYREFFSRAGRLQSAVRSVVDPAYEGLDGYQQLQMNMLMLTAIGMVEVLTLVGNGMGHGAMKIVRGVLENAINMEYMRRFPEQAEKYLEWQWVEHHKLYRHLEETSPASLVDFPAEIRARDDAEYERVKGMFEYQIQRNGRMKTVMQDSWCRDNLFERAQKIGMAESYRTVMPSANQILHGSISSWLRELDEVSRRIEYPPTHKWGPEALIAAHMGLLQAVETCATSLNATPNPSIESLKEDFRAIWGADAPAVAPEPQRNEVPVAGSIVVEDEDDVPEVSQE